MKTIKKLMNVTFGVLLLTSTVVFANNNDPIKKSKTGVTSEMSVEKKATIVGVAASNEDFSTLVAAVTAADLVETLSSEGPFTVFAPVNAAFDKLPDGTVSTLLKPESKGTLTAVLTYHVVAGKLMAADVIAAIEKNDGSFSVKTVQGGMLTATIKDGKVILTDEKGGMSTVVMTDVAASNGVIHAIDTVVMPK
jgi:uncharacterized surface protein with fasciclin (FAS1) repeats